MSYRVTFGGTRRPLEEYAAATEKDPYATIWEGGKVVNFDDLDCSAFDQIAAANPEVGLTDLGIYQRPNVNGAVRYAVIRAAAEFAGIDPPPPPRTMADQKRLANMIEATLPIEDEPMEDGFPKEQDEASSSSSSTAPENTTGLPTSPEDSESETS